MVLIGGQSGVTGIRRDGIYYGCYKGRSAAGRRSEGAYRVVQVADGWTLLRVVWEHITKESGTRTYLPLGLFASEQDAEKEARRRMAEEDA